jgi:hypothetical protein
MVFRMGDRCGHPDRRTIDVVCPFEVETAVIVPSLSQAEVPGIQETPCQIGVLVWSRSSASIARRVRTYAPAITTATIAAMLRLRDARME